MPFSLATRRRVSTISGQHAWRHSASLTIENPVLQNEHRANTNTPDPAQIFWFTRT